MQSMYIKFGVGETYRKQIYCVVNVLNKQFERIYGKIWTSGSPIHMNEWCTRTHPFTKTTRLSSNDNTIFPLSAWHSGPEYYIVTTISGFMSSYYNVLNFICLDTKLRSENASLKSRIQLEWYSNTLHWNTGNISSD